MSTFGLPVTCPTCGGDVELLNARSHGTLSVAVVECRPCQKEWEITARIVYHGRNQAAERAEAEGKRRPRARETVPA